VNSISYYEVLLKLRDAIRRKRLGQPTGNPRENSRTTMGTSWTSIPDLAPSDFHPFGRLKNRRGGKRFSDDEVETEAREWDKQTKDFNEYSAGFGEMTERWDKGINVGRGNVEK
jgi:hypothetical protein